MKKYQAMILDFDGVVVESVGIKDDAFQELFKEYSSQMSAILQYHRTHNATIRYEKFRYIYEEILGLTYTAEVATRLGKQFSQMIYEKILACPFVNGSLDFLNLFIQQSLFYLVSINPAEELKSLLAARNINNYFSEIYAHPWGKADAIRDILRRNDFLENNVVLIGDSPEDYDAAQMVGVDFIGRQSHRSWMGKDCVVFKDMAEISQYLRIQSGATL